MMQIKICGIRDLPTALQVCEAGATMLGLNFYAQSPRCIDLKTCLDLIPAVRKAHPDVKILALFVNHDREFVEHVNESINPDYFQFSGEESVNFLQTFSPKAVPVIRLSDKNGYMDASNVSMRNFGDFFILDAVHPFLYGGTGKTVDWNTAALLAQSHRFLLAGGLKPDNIRRAVLQVKPWGVDIASGVESRPGIKDIQKVIALVQAVRSAEMEINESSHLEVKAA